MAHMIEMKKVSKFYSGNGTVSTGFSKVDLNFDLGEFVVVTGESGGGKSTLLNVISGLDSYEEGEMFVAGKDTGGFRTEDYEEYRKKYIGNIFQDYNLINSYTVYQNVELALILNGYNNRNKKKLIKDIIKWVGLEKYEKTRVSKLSGGQKQRVAIARAFAKDSPIIVADEPTGNLDTDAANKVMETLYRISKNKLVIVVTHNYEQAEPYATRKIMMRDGRVVEDRRLKDSETITEDSIRTRKSKSNKLSSLSQLRLGLRNTFNLPAKFLLLLFIFMFVSVSVLGSYASNLNIENEEDLIGMDTAFADKSPHRLVLQRSDKKKFTKKDFNSIKNAPNVNYIIKKDLSLDNSVILYRGETSIEGPLYSYKSLKKKDLAYGRLPKREREIVIGAEEFTQNYEELKEKGESLIGKTFRVDNNAEGEETVSFINKPLKIVGITFKKSDNERIKKNGYSRIFCTDSLANRQIVFAVSAASTVTLDFDGKTVKRKGASIVYPTDLISPGKAYIFKEDAENYYKEGRASGKQMSITVENMFFKGKRSFEIDAVVKKENMERLLELAKDDYDTYAESIFVNKADYKRLYDRGDYQISVFTKDYMKNSDTIKALKSKGYTVLEIRNVSKNNRMETILLVQKMFSRLMLGILLVTLFFIAYVVIRLVMRSRNSYYSTLRILGASKRNTGNILRIELLVVMSISVIIVGLLILAFAEGYLQFQYVNGIVKFITVRDYVLLVVTMTIMSLLISGRYAKKIFGNSAMRVYRGEA